MKGHSGAAAAARSGWAAAAGARETSRTEEPPEGRDSDWTEAAAASFSSRSSFTRLLVFSSRSLNCAGDAPNACQECV